MPELPLSPKRHLQPPRWTVHTFSAAAWTLSLAGALGGALVLRSGESFGLGLGLFGIPVALLLVRVPLTYWARAQGRDLDARWDDAEHARRDGRLEDAVEILERCAQHRRVPRAHARSLLELGLCLSRLGRFEEAVLAFAGLERHPGARVLRLESLGASWAATAMALGGRNVRADEWVEVARGRQGVEDEFWLVPRAILLARQGDPHAAFEILAGCWWRMGQSLTERSMRLARIVMAFAASNLEEPDYTPEFILQGVLPASPLEYDFLGRQWPEMASFLEDQGLNIAREDLVRAQRSKLTVVH